MAKMVAMLKEAESVFSVMLGLGLFGILFLVLYGNLSGNLGFTQDSVEVLNESKLNNSVIVYVNDTDYTLLGSTDVGAGTFSITAIWNATTNGLGLYNYSIGTANATVSSVGVVSNDTALLWDNVSLSYTYLRDSDSQKNSDGVITNLTGGAVTFFSFANVWFTLLAITVLIAIILGVIALVRRKDGGSSRGGSRFSN